MRDAVASAFLLHEARASARGRIHRHLLDEVRGLREAFVDEAWDQIGDRALRCLGLGYGAIQRARMDAAHAATRGAAATAVHDAEVAYWQQFASGRGREAAERMRGYLRERRPDMSATMDGPLSELAAGRADAAGRLVTARSARGATPYLGELAIACLSRGLLGLVHLSFHAELEVQRSNGERLGRVEVEDALAATVASRAEGLAARQRGLQELLATSPNTAAIVGVAIAVTAALEAEVPALGSLQAKGFAICEAIRARGQGHRASKLGSIVARAGRLLRESLATHAACWRLAVEAGLPERSPQVAKLIADAGTRPFDVALPNGKNTSIAHVPDAAAGALIEVGGFVSAVSAARTADKLIGSVEIEDAANGSRVRASTLFTHLPHRGIALGAYVRLHGTVKGQGDAAVVDIQRLPLAELATKAWRIGLVQLADRWFSAWPNGIHLDWSLGPHISGANEGTAPSCGAGEIIFPPLVRAE